MRADLQLWADRLAQEFVVRDDDDPFADQLARLDRIAALQSGAAEEDEVPDAEPPHR